MFIYREFFPNFRVHGDAISPFLRQSTPFRLKIADFPANFPCIPPLTAPGLIAVRPRAFPLPPAAFPAPAPAARGLPARLPSPGRTPSRGRAGAGLRARTGRGENLVMHEDKATDKRL